MPLKLDTTDDLLLYTDATSARRDASTNSKFEKLNMHSWSHW